MPENANAYGQIMEEVYLSDGTVHKIGFRAGKWIAETKYERVAISKKGFLLYLKYSEDGRAHSYRLFYDFAALAAEANHIDFLFLGKVAAAIGADYIEFLD